MPAVTREPRTASLKPAHPVAQDLVGGLALGAAALRARPDAAKIGGLIETIANAEYWLSFELASFEPLLALSPSPLRELGVGIALRFAEGIDGRLTEADLSRARKELVAGLPPDVEAGVLQGIESLERGVAAREAIPSLAAEGFEPYAPSQALSVHALRAGGRANLEIIGARQSSHGFEAKAGTKLILAASDDRGKPLDPPEVESRPQRPLLAKPHDTPGARQVVVLIPGTYQVRVPGRAEGAKSLLVR